MNVDIFLVRFAQTDVFPHIIDLVFLNGQTQRALTIISGC